MADKPTVELIARFVAKPGKEGELKAALLAACRRGHNNCILTNRATQLLTII
jgi:hypothetical protein